MIYTALLRGINIGGKNKIAMPHLKQVFEQEGMTSVATYINSGNVIFVDRRRNEASIAKLLETAIQRELALNIPTLVLSFRDMQTVVSALPDDWQNDKTMKSDVLFLWDTLDGPSMIEPYIKPKIDRVIHVPRAVLWSVDRDKATKSGLMKVAGTRLYQQMTVRNVNTTRKVYQLMSQISSK